ncbi:MAG: rod shape-determining protein MreD [Candidatus Azotimanducaceae bacterium]|jgi:rod shape-determining protein MreD
MFKLYHLIIYLSFAIGLLLLILPLPDGIRIYRPDWLALIIIYWSMALPKYVGLWTALIIGLFVDSLLGTLLGQHALALVVITYLNLNLHLRIRVLSLVQQSVYVFGLLLINQTIIFWIDGITGLTIPVQALFGAPLIGALLWPCVFIILRDIRRKAMFN